MRKKQQNIDYKKITPDQLIFLKSAENEKLMNKNTAIAYIRVWSEFAEYLDSVEVLSFDDLSKSHVLHFLKKYKMKPFAYNQKRSAIMRILNDIKDDYDVDIPKLESLKRQIKSQTVKSNDRLFLNKKALREIRETAICLYEDRIIRERNLLSYDLLQHTMMRVDEVALIQICDINLGSKKIGVRGKGSGGDTMGNRAVNAYLPLSPKLIEQLIEYVRSWRISYNGDPCKPYLEHPLTVHRGMPLFTSRRGNALGVASIKNVINGMIKKYYVEIGEPLPKNHGPHCIRRSVATIIYNKNKDIILIQRMLRHASHVTTMKYIGVDESELEAAFLDDL